MTDHFCALAPGLIDTAMQDYLCGLDASERFPSLARIQAARGPERHRLRGEKSGAGWEARLLLLTYAFLRGVPYRTLAPKCREDSSICLRRPLIHWAGETVKAWDSQERGEVEELMEAWLDAKLPDDREEAA